MGKTSIEAYRCDRCGHEWLPRIKIDTPPTICPKCKSYYWNKPTREEKAAILYGIKDTVSKKQSTQNNKKEDKIKWIPTKRNNLFPNQWYIFIKTQQPPHDFRIISLTEMYNNLVELSKQYGIVSGIDLVPAEHKHFYDFILRVGTTNTGIFEEMFEKIKSFGWVHSVDYKPIHIIEVVGITKNTLAKVYINSFYDPTNFSQYENYLKGIKNAHPTYDTSINEGSSSGKKITKKKVTKFIKN